tara:strand:- start:4850 stop:5155 length:306 start_codon:yes stop_codon:yes gene_type:complete
LKILKPTNTTHSITLNPRKEANTLLVLELTNKVSNEVLEIENTYTFVSGVLTMSFDLVVSESQHYSIEVRQNSKVIYIGLAFCTEQMPQDYKLTSDKFTYV